MPSPFPGMDPYLEPHWQAVHQVLITDAWRLLNRELPVGLVACVEERVSVETDDDRLDPGRLGPDVRISDRTRAADAPGAIVIDAPLELEPADEEPVERFVSIVDADGRLVTGIEFVSPSNKRRPGLARFKRNRADRLAGGVHAVEIDLVRAGNWRALMRPEGCPPNGVATYRAVVRTAGPEGRSHLYPIHLRQPLPDVQVPLRMSDVPAVLPLQRMLTAVYDDGRWASRIDYRRPIRPPLPPDDAAWAAALLAGRSH